MPPRAPPRPWAARRWCLGGLRKRGSRRCYASDGFQALLAITLAGVGGAAAAGVTLAAGVTHPVTLYLILAVTVTITVVSRPVRRERIPALPQGPPNPRSSNSQGSGPRLPGDARGTLLHCRRATALRSRGTAALPRTAHCDDPCTRGECRSFYVESRLFGNNCT